MDHTQLRAAAAARNERMRKPVKVELDGIGTLYVRSILIAEKSYAEEVVKQKDETGNAEALVMAWLLCDEAGERLSEGDREAWVEVFRDSPRSDYNMMWAAANSGADAGN